MGLKNYYIHLALILSAASGLIYEVVATNMLFFYFIRNTYSISTVLSVFLLGLGIGSFLIHKFRTKIHNKRNLFGVLQILIAVYSIIILTNLVGIIPSIHTFGVFISSFVLLLIPTTMLGAIFPLAGSMMGADEKDVTGLVYSFDLSGAVVGSLLAGFLLIPSFGNKFAIFFAVVLNLISAIIMLKKWKRYFCVAFMIVVIVLIIKSRLDLKDPMDVYFSKASAYGEVVVNNGTLYIDGRDQCSLSYRASRGEKTIVTYTLEPLDSRKLKVLNIGLGCGLTLSKIAEKVDLIIDIVEINPVVVEANKLISNVLKNKKVNLIIDDGLNYLRSADKKYDAIILDIENPAVIHSSDLYTVEAFQLIADALDDQGIFGLWSYELETFEYYDTIYYSLKEAFPYVYILSTDVFIASKQELDYPVYYPKTEKKLNTLDHKIISKMFYEKKGEYFVTDNPYYTSG